MKITQIISNDPQFTEVERIADVESLLINWTHKQIILDCSIKYFKDGLDISEKFSKRNASIIANNEKFITPRDENGDLVEEMEDYEEPLLIDNEMQYDENNHIIMETKQRIIKFPMYDYLINFVTQNISIESQVKRFIIENDEENFF